VNNIPFSAYIHYFTFYEILRCYENKTKAENDITLIYVPCIVNFPRSRSLKLGKGTAAGSLLTLVSRMGKHNIT
jgi:hypothetical protein